MPFAQRSGPLDARAKSLFANGVPLVANVLVAGIGGFLFWIVTARVAPPAVVAQAAALVSSMFGVVQLSQQHLIVNLPPMIANAPRPRAMAIRAYALAGIVTTMMALGFVVVGPRLASGLEFVRDDGLAVLFVAGCLAWSWFSLQDAVLAGIRKGPIVLIENSAWTVARLGMVLCVPLMGVGLGAGWIVGSWLVPAFLLVVVVSWYLFVGPNAALAMPRGTRQLDRRTMFTHMGFEHLTALANGIATIVLPAVALSALGADAAAPFLAAFSFILVCENALASFANAFAVEISRSRDSVHHLFVTAGALLGTLSLAAIAGALLFADDFMALFGQEYREPGGQVLIVLVLGLPARSVWLLAGAVNRVDAAGAKNLVQQLAFTVALVGALLIVPLESGTAIAWCAVLARWAAAVVSAADLAAAERRRASDRRATVSVA